MMETSRLPRRSLGLSLFSFAFLAALTAISWAHFGRMEARGGGGLPEQANWNPWTLADFGTAAVMWSFMMAGMMLPTTAPWVWQLGRAWKTLGKRQGWWIPVAFITGYLCSWSAFSLGAALFQGLVQRPAAALAPGALPYLNGIVLILAGLYQWSPIKQRCLTHCRSPLAFLLTSWRPGVGGGFRMGLRHGFFCVGCCWLLMLLSFVVGVMNLFWMALLTAYVFIDHVLLKSPTVGHLVGLLLVAWGVWEILGG